MTSLRKLFYELELTDEFCWRDFFSIIISFIALVVVGVCMIRIQTLNRILNFSNAILIFSCIVIWLSIVLSNCCAVINKKKVIGSKLENKELEIENSSLTELTDNVRCFKHDFNNIIQAIDGYMIVKDLNSLQKYLDSLVDECNRTNLMDVLNNQISESPAICGVLINKLKIAETKNVKMNIEILGSLKAFNEKAYLISRMLGILLDNALEASGSCSEQKLVNIRFSTVGEKDKNSIIIENTYEDKNLDTNKIFEKNYSTKAGNSGLGLGKVKNILNKDSSFELFTTKDDNIFKQELEIYNYEKSLV